MIAMRPGPCRVVALALLALVKTGIGSSAHAQPAARPAALVVLVRTPALGADGLQALSAALRPQLGASSMVRVVDGAPSGTGEAAIGWADEVLAREGADQVLWVENTAPHTARIWIASGRGQPPLSFEVAERREFDRIRSLAIGASAILRELHTQAPTPDAGVLHANGQPTADASLQSPPATRSGPEREPQSARPSTFPETAEGGSDAHQRRVPTPRQSTFGLSAALGPAFRLSGDGTSLGFDARVGVRLHRHFAVRAEVALNREEVLAFEDDDGALLRNRVGLTVQALARLPIGSWVFRAGSGVGVAIPSLAVTSGTRAAVQIPRNEALVSPVVEPCASAAWRLAEDLFVELALAASLPLHQPNSVSGVHAAPPFEFSMGAALGFGTP